MTERTESCAEATSYGEPLARWLLPEEPIRVAHVVGKVVMGGVDQVVMNYYRHIDRSKIQFDFYMDGQGDTPIDDEIRALGGRVFKLPPYEHSLRRNLAEFRTHLREHNYRVVHSHMNTLSVFWLREAKRAGVPVRIAHNHSTGATGEGVRALVKHALRPLARVYPSHYLACSNHAAEWLFGKEMLASGRVELLKNAIDISRFEYDESTRLATRTELGFRNEFVVGHVGRFEYQKNHETLVEAFYELLRLHGNSRLLLVGDGTLRRSVETMCERRGISDRVTFTGTRTDVPRLMQAMDCFVLPSRYEGLGMVAVEAQTAGLPCLISSEVPREAIVSDECRRMPPEASPLDWAAAAFEIARGTFRARGSHRSVENGYEIRTQAAALTDLYLRALK